MTADEGPPGPAAPPWRAGGGERLRTLTVRGRVLRVAVRDGDPDWPPLLLCNGIGVSLELLQPFVDALDPRRGVIRFDMPGVGGSPAPVVPYHLITTGPLLAGLLDQLGHDAGTAGHLPGEAGSRRVRAEPPGPGAPPGAVDDRARRASWWRRAARASCGTCSSRGRCR